MVLNFGKYHGRTTEWVWENDRSYAEWVMRTPGENAWFKLAQVEFRRYAAAAKDQFFRDAGADFGNADQFTSFDELLRKARKFQEQEQQRRHGFHQEQRDRFDRDYFGYRPPPQQPGTAWWTTLGVNPSDSVAVIKTAYRKLASKHHPDKGGDVKTMQKINAAYDAAMKGR